MSKPAGYTAWDGSWKQWTHEDNKRPHAECYDCGLPYPHGADCVIDDAMWERINPTLHRGAGLLCANCIMARLDEIGESEVHAILF